MTEPIDRVASVTERIRRRSHDQRQAYLDDIAAMESSPDSDRRQVGCSNMAHAAAAAGADQDQILAGGAGRVPNIGIITAYNDMLSAHQPFEGYPQIIRAAARGAGGTAQVAGGVPAMCDGVTQGRPGMELSLMSRDVIAMATA
ncbi:MAG: dihydroxy-acid dehydratase, partial [Pseudomonadota bacterium]|nr:dihydroxy-acid dehydratase [Pseudomonadota bacterium]